MLPDHVSRGGTRRDELRGDQRGERQQVLLQGEVQGGAIRRILGMAETLTAIAKLT